ncbi:hypothetical protein JCM5296_007344 [Sporobolomyces johnsonii]
MADSDAGASTPKSASVARVERGQGPESKPEACTNCRAVKRRCIHDGGGAVCTRCAKMGLECVYHQMKRGRKAGSGNGPRKRPSTGPGPESRKASPEAATRPPAPSAGPSAGGTAAQVQSDWLAEYLKNQQAHTLPQPQPHPPYPVASTSRGLPSSFPPAAPSYPAPLPPAAIPPTSLPPINPLPPYPTTLATSPAAASFTPNPVTSLHSSVAPSRFGDGQSPSSGYPSPAGQAASPSGPVPAPATGGFSLKKLMAANNQGSSENEPLRQSLADAFAVAEDGKRLGKQPERVFEDVVAAGILPEEQVEGLFAFYFHHLNPMTSVLDPALHTIEFCRSRSPFLFTAILTVACKVALPTLYPPALKYAKRLLSQAFETGINNIELVQAIATMTFWADPTDDSCARKLAYAIRSAFELNIHKAHKRPLPDDELQRRLALNSERTWLYLTVADHRLNTQRGLPKLIPNEYRVDAVPWLLEQKAEEFCPHAAGLAPLIELGRLLDLYSVVVSPEEGTLPSKELLGCLEREVEAWKSQWTLEKPCIQLQPAQTSLVRFYARVFCFQIDEIYLFCAIKGGTNRSDGINGVTFNARDSPLVVFGSCIRSAISVLDTMSTELRFMVYSFDSMWVGAASAAIWLAQNIVGMAPNDRESSLAAISRLKAACDECSTGAQSMAAYTSRLLQHLLSKTQSQATEAVPPVVPFVQASLNAPALDSGRGTAGMFAGGMLGGGASNGLQGIWSFEAPQQQQQQQQQQLAFDSQVGPFLSSMQPPMPSIGEDLLYPAADDALWTSLFPLFSQDSQ